MTKDGCWEWMGATNQYGYGAFTIRLNHNERLQMGSHRIAYELSMGHPIPEGLSIDHLCRNTKCVNPQHLEPVTQRVNTLRGLSLSGINARKRECPKCGGSYEMDSRGKRFCRKCKQTYELARYYRVKKIVVSGP